MIESSISVLGSVFKTDFQIMVFTIFLSFPNKCQFTKKVVSARVLFLIWDGKEVQNRSYSFVYTFKSAVTNYLEKSLMEVRMKIIWLGFRWRGKCILPVKKPYNIPAWKAQRNILTQKKKKRKKTQKTSIC